MKIYYKITFVSIVEDMNKFSHLTTSKKFPNISISEK
jgi:hypothetical protein